VFDKHPNLKVMLGHFGETLPFLLWRIDMALRRPGGKQVDFRGIFCKNFYVTTSGFFSNPALLCTMMEMGIDHILFAVDWPFVLENKPAVDWIAGAPISAEDKAKILSENAKRLLRM
jgi:2,3-dihydroxybenzoate decarboxylase